MQENELKDFPNVDIHIKLLVIIFSQSDVMICKFKNVTNFMFHSHLQTQLRLCTFSGAKV